MQGAELFDSHSWRGKGVERGEEGVQPGAKRKHPLAAPTERPLGCPLAWRARAQKQNSAALYQALCPAVAGGRGA